MRRAACLTPPTVPATDKNVARDSFHYCRVGNAGNTTPQGDAKVLDTLDS